MGLRGSSGGNRRAWGGTRVETGRGRWQRGKERSRVEERGKERRREEWSGTKRKGEKGNREP